ncbi:ABC transporter permease [Magnetospira sp. QH-2]|uniref:cell division protein FtsX n=1 Tax=Magnetospira sp. (strain QH-2) TaxID=1288970 RepID=UPI0003E81879|nr:FtsX-like permease family protein [Magnetospira sp. QH-2]CCQ74744.1 putative cell division ABC transporter FtsX [Magnetospira sp. QH-2]
MSVRRTDLPLDRDGIGKFLPWLIAFMVFLAALTLAGALTMERLAARWDQGVEATLTIQIPASDKVAETNRRVDTIRRMLNEIPDVTQVQVLDPRSLRELLAPWLGPPETLGDLPLPRLIDVHLSEDADLKVEDLAVGVAEKIPGATVDDHQVWLNRLIGLMRTAEGVATSVVILIGLAMVATIVFATRTGLAIHQDVIEVLHLTGAQDNYIARQFGERSLMLGLKGGLIGLLLAGPTLWALGTFAEHLGAEMLPEMTLSTGDLVVLGCLPVLSGLTAMLTAHRTVLSTLRRMF